MNAFPRKRPLQRETYHAATDWERGGTPEAPATGSLWAPRPHSQAPKVQRNRASIKAKHIPKGGRFSGRSNPCSSQHPQGPVWLTGFEPDLLRLFPVDVESAAFPAE